MYSDVSLSFRLRVLPCRLPFPRATPPPLHERGVADTDISAIEGALQIRQAMRDPARCEDLRDPLRQSVASLDAMHAAFLDVLTPAQVSA